MVILKDYDSYFFHLSEKIRKIIMKTLKKHDSNKLKLFDDDLKGEHEADREVYSRLLNFFSKSKIPANVHIEGEESHYYKGNPKFVIMIDPIDGSLNRDLNVGDPGIVVTFSLSLKPKFRDICFGYIYGIHSSDIYYSKNGKSFYKKRGNRAIEMHCEDTVNQLKDAILYYNDGYGTEFAKASFRKAGALPFFVKHHNAFDNTALEICQISRGAAHIRVEARSYVKGNKLKGSDHANILPAFAIGAPSGLIITDLNGNSIENIEIDLDKTQDFIICANKNLLTEALNIIKDNLNTLKIITETKSI
jgi:fructose-1,6-bisphosphatase/inositol monophosphatase family enzyme